MNTDPILAMTSCIIWTGARTAPDGYGQLTIRGKSWTAHRRAYFNKYGPIPDGLLVCHRCNNKLCVNVDHLYLGTNQQNIQDAARDGLLRNQNTNKTECSKCGGPYSVNAHGRYCKECKKVSNRKTAAKRRSAAKEAT